MSSVLPAAELAAIWSAPGEGERLWFLGNLAVVRVPGEAVDGRFALIEFLFPRHASPPLHTHPQDESYVVLEGQLTVQAGANRFQLSAALRLWSRHLSRTRSGSRAIPLACW